MRYGDPHFKQKSYPRRSALRVGSNPTLTTILWRVTNRESPVYSWAMVEGRFESDGRLWMTGSSLKGFESSPNYNG